MAFSLGCPNALQSKEDTDGTDEYSSTHELDSIAGRSTGEGDGRTGNSRHIRRGVAASDLYLRLTVAEDRDCCRTRGHSARSHGSCSHAF